MYKLLILDFDGTIGNTTQFIVQIMMASFDALHMKKPSVEACTRTIGLPLAQCFVQSYKNEGLPEMSEETGLLCAETYRRIFEEKKKPGAILPYPGCIETLRKLHNQGIVLTIASSRNHSSLMDFVREFGIEDIISYVIGADDVTEAKPSAEPVTRTLQALGFSPSETLVVGDTCFDILMGHNAHCDTCGVTYGNGTIEELKEAGAEYIIERFEDLRIA
jgi:HAD superfamily hydrolase (TIGR01509 family)